MDRRWRQRSPNESFFPQDIRTDVGQVSLVLSPSVIGNLEGAFRYLRDYSYICWEQVLTRGVMASHYNDLKAYLAEDFTWPDSEHLPQSMLAQGRRTTRHPMAA